jgi:hypothetical protein
MYIAGKYPNGTFCRFIRLRTVAYRRMKLNAVPFADTCFSPMQSSCALSVMTSRIFFCDSFSLESLWCLQLVPQWARVHRTTAVVHDVFVSRYVGVDPTQILPSPARSRPLWCCTDFAATHATHASRPGILVDRSVITIPFAPLSDKGNNHVEGRVTQPTMPGQQCRLRSFGSSYRGHHCNRFRTSGQLLSGLRCCPCSHLSPWRDHLEWERRCSPLRYW